MALPLAAAYAAGDSPSRFYVDGDFCRGTAGVRGVAVRLYVMRCAAAAVLGTGFALRHDNSVQY